LSRRVQRLQDYVDSYAYLLGDPIWFQSTDKASLDSFLEAFLVRIGSDSIDGMRISTIEQGELTALGLPGPVTIVDATALIERWNRTVDYWDSGVFLYSQVPAGQSTNFIELVTWKTL